MIRAIRKFLSDMRRARPAKGQAAEFSAMMARMQQIRGEPTQGPSETAPADLQALAQCPAPPPTEPAQPGRQAIQMPGETSPTIFGTMMVRPWSRPIPDGAHQALWEDCHLFAAGAKPKRDPYHGLIGGDPPLAFVCPGCELEQTPLDRGGERACGYCGLRIKVFGTRVFWWRNPVDVPEWKP